jgi:uncharacterized protein (TIGR03118 family)
MKARLPSRTAPLAVLAALAAALFVVAPLGAAEDNAYTVTRIVSDQAGVAPHQDGVLRNGWGLVGGATPWWVVNNDSNTSTVYRPDGTKLLQVAVDGGPTGVVFNSNTSAFLLGTTNARFIFASMDGGIRAWNGGAAATQVASTPGAVYTGLALLGTRLYAANLAGGVDVFGSAFEPTTVPGGFADPGLPDGWAPFGIQAIGSRIFVTFVKVGEEDGEIAEEHGQGLGIVDAFDANGNLLARVAQRGQLNAPWGLAQAPAQGFGRFSGDLLVGSFGDGTIGAYEELPNGRFEYRGQLRSADSSPLVIDGLWALEFGAGNANSGPATTLFFTAGPGDEEHGLFGSITAD